ncbi:MAG: hypothetical protein C0621_02580 [Desulfuromonas sp.]|nr:MAG: hypothetical protein C0621_02580 [Desulfuromonas sp.]
MEKSSNDILLSFLPRARLLSESDLEGLKTLLADLARRCGCDDALLWVPPSRRQGNRQLSGRGVAGWLPAGDLPSPGYLPLDRVTFVSPYHFIPLLPGADPPLLVLLGQRPLAPALTRSLLALSAVFPRFAEPPPLADPLGRRTLRSLTVLEKSLHLAGSIEEAFSHLCRTLFHQRGILAAGLRPLHGNTLLGNCFFQAAIPQGAVIEAMRRSAQELSWQVVQCDGYREQRSDDFLALSAPLRFQGRVLGILTLFAEGQETSPVWGERRQRRFVSAIYSLFAHALERITAHEARSTLAVENERKLRETATLYRISKAIHSTVKMDELTHLILSAAAVPDGGGFERAMLFMLNERSGMLQGMLGVTRESALFALLGGRDKVDWEQPRICPEAEALQHKSPFCRQVVKQRLAGRGEENPLARALQSQRVIFVPHPRHERGAALFAETLQLGPYACAPLLGRHRPLGVLVVDNPESKQEITAQRLYFLELFASQASAAMENSLLLRNLELANQELHKTEERLMHGEKMALLGEMAASIAHELKNPLVAIGGFASRIARKESDPGKMREYGEIIHREGVRLEEMLDSILGFSRKQLLCFSEVDPEGMVEKSLELERDLLAAAKIDLRLEIVRPLPKILGDAAKLHQVMINLLANARQAMLQGGVLTLRVFPGFFRGAEAVSIEVEDSGEGIGEERIGRVFAPFFSTKDNGTGLGLAISCRIVEQHRGELLARNGPQGAIFTIKLPVGKDGVSVVPNY